MAILIINRRDHAITPYESWLISTKQKLVMLSSSEYQLSYNHVVNNYEHMEWFDHFSVNGNVEKRAIALHKIYKFTAIIAISESDLIRAAELRDYLGIPGQTMESALAFRNKVMMKDKLKHTDIQLSPYCKVTSSLDLLKFVASHSYPIVVKKVDGTGSKEVAIIHTESELEHRLEEGFKGEWIAEKFVSGRIYHIDGVAMKGELLFCWPSVYINSCLAYMDAKPSGSYILEADNPLVTRLNEMVNQILSYMPCPEVIAFHAEIFHTEDDELILCEIASRVGGSKIGITLKTAFNIDLMKTWVQMQCGIPIAWESVEREPRTISGNVLVHPGKGTFLGPPETEYPDEIIDFELLASFNQHFNYGRNCNDCLASFVLIANSEQDIEERLLAAVDWFQTSMKWDNGEIIQHA